MIISDLNHLEVAEVSVVGGFNQGYDYSNIYFKEDFKIDKYVNSNTYVRGYLATSESDAQAYGYNGTLTQTFNNTTTSAPFLFFPGSSSSNGVSISASN
jgi:hypothetical protein